MAAAMMLLFLLFATVCRFSKKNSQKVALKNSFSTGPEEKRLL
jgi:hypothetical protein